MLTGSMDTIQLPRCTSSILQVVAGVIFGPSAVGDPSGDAVDSILSGEDARCLPGSHTSNQPVHGHLQHIANHDNTKNSRKTGVSVTDRGLEPRTC